MAKDVTISARVPAALDAGLEKLAAATGRSKSWHVNAALEAYLAAELAFLAAVDEGLADLEAGRVVEHEEIVADAAQRRHRPAA
jgi:predicted transcriptional regulator